MTTIIDGDSLVTTPTSTTTDLTTSGEELIYVDTSTAAVTVTLASADVDDGRRVRIVDTGLNAGTNNITIDTEGSATINPGANASITLSVDGTWVDLRTDGSNWFADLAPQVSSLQVDGDATVGGNATVTGNATISGATTTDTLTASTSLTDAAANTITDLTGAGLEVASGALSILSTIWDGTNLVADVNNTTTTTTEVNNSDYHETVSTDATVTGATSIDVSSANAFEHTLTGNVTYSFMNPSSSPAGNSFALLVQQDGTGGHTITWPGSVEWANGAAPSPSTAASSKHEFVFRTYDGGTSWIGSATEDIA